MTLAARFKNAGSLFKQLPGTFRLFWSASPRGAVLLGLLTLVAAVLPAGERRFGILSTAGISQNELPYAGLHRLLSRYSTAPAAASSAARRELYGSRPPR